MTKKYKIDVNIVDDHTMLVEGLSKAINRSDLAHVSHCYSTLEECRLRLTQWMPDVLLLDISMPDGSGMDFCRQVMEQYPSLRVVMITCHDEFSIIQRMMDIGVHGYVLKSAPVQEVLDAIVAVYHGEQYQSSEVASIIERGKNQQIFLTPTERVVLQGICDGLTNPQIANTIHLSIETVNWYRKRLLAKFNVNNSVTLALIAVREQFV